MLDAELEQRSREWLAARVGSVGASEVPDLARKTKTGWSATRDALMTRKLIERLTGRPVETYKSQAMLEGIEREPEARRTYCMMFDVEVEPVGLVRHPFITGSHASPDGFVGTRGLVEIKCPQPPAHLETLLRNEPERDYVVQMQWQMSCTGRDWCDFVSYCPAFPGRYALFTGRVERDAKLIWELEEQVTDFLVELEKKLHKLAHFYAMEVTP